MADKSKSIMKKSESMKSDAMDIDDIQSNESDGETGEPVTIVFASHLNSKLSLSVDKYLQNMAWGLAKSIKPLYQT